MGKTVEMKHEMKGGVDLLETLDNVAISLRGPQVQLALLQQVIVDLGGEALIYDDNDILGSLVDPQRQYGPICQVLPHFLSDIRIKLERINDYISNVRCKTANAGEVKGS